MQEVDIVALRADTAIAGKYWGRTFAALAAITYREKGEQAVRQLMGMILNQQGGASYLEGLRKLGIRDDEPPAVKAAKYHVLSNQLGGLDMEYVEETPKKVWIRYHAPKGTYAGVAMLAMPAAIDNEMTRGWHARNGLRMGCPRLGWVATKSLMQMDPYMEGYFMEYDRDLAPGEEWRYESVVSTPAFDPSKMPLLDPQVWPEARKLKAGRNFARLYVGMTVDCLFQLVGQETTFFLVKQVMRGVAIQFTHEFKRDMGIEGKDAKAIATFLYKLHLACGQNIQLAESEGTFRITFRSHLPYANDLREELRAANFEFPVMVARLINGRISVTRQVDGQAETWVIRDAGRWLW